MWFFFLIFFLANSHRCFSRKVGETRNDDHFLFSPTLREKEQCGFAKKKNDKKNHIHAHTAMHIIMKLLYSILENLRNKKICLILTKALPKIYLKFLRKKGILN